MGRIKTEAVKGVAEYAPVVTINTTVDDYNRSWEVDFRYFLTKSISACKAVNLKSAFPEVVSFNNNLDDPRWLWNEEALSTLHIWRLNDIYTILSNRSSLGMLIK